MGNYLEGTYKTPDGKVTGEPSTASGSAHSTATDTSSSTATHAGNNSQSTSSSTAKAPSNAAATTTSASATPASGGEIMRAHALVGALGLGAALNARRFQTSALPFELPSVAHRIVSSPLKYLSQQLYALQLFVRGAPLLLPAKRERIHVLCISDTHCLKPEQLPIADLLIHAGDLTNAGTADEIQDQVDWLKSLDYKYKIVIAGNHDSYFDPRSRGEQDKYRQINWGDGQQKILYLQHSSIELDFNQHGRTLTVFGAPQIPACGGPEFAFQYPRGQDAWSGTVPADTDILVTHTPPKYHLDLPRGMGCEWLLEEVWRVRPRLHVFGHVHCGHGQEGAFWDDAQKAFERLGARNERGPLVDLVGLRGWLDAARLLVSSTLGLIWSRVWGGTSNNTLMVNAALMTGSTGRLGNNKAEYVPNLAAQVCVERGSQLHE
ncbi:uncharacterized protein KY384_005528 [Bacidia gigantensis]|uniref:uncharacterized protein n=1 Tax=Bacidia gigantensis TaxID=2732470 RepID=UPI001D049363|nr:uncharacterized protein KY384_005528 [Bacidia gigantensis]KAG8530046.1 hypothetical protein KY384_005528 [Bacidia gigantensis]